MCAGADFLIVGNGELTSADSIVGGADSDVIVAGGALTIVDAAFTNVTTFEEIESDTNNGIMNLTGGPLMIAAGVVLVTGGTAADIIDLSGITAASATTITAGNGDNVVTGGAGIDTITTGTGADIITGGKGADILVGGDGEDVYVFASTAALNGIDVFGANIVVGDDRLDFSSFLPGGSFNATVIQHDGADNINITDKIVMGATTANTVADLNTAAKIVAQFGFEEAFQIASGGKAVIIAGDDAGAVAGGQIWFVDDTLDGVNGTVSATDVVQVATHTLDIDTLLAKNFIT
jgi:Ca2+-binding RTX toxin-like protein